MEPLIQKGKNLPNEVYDKNFQMKTLKLTK